MHLRRWITALVVLPLLAIILFKGGRLSFILLLLIINGLGQWEFLVMFQPGADLPRKAKAVILGSMVLLSFCCTAHTGTTAPTFILVFCLFALFLFYLFSYGHIPQLGLDLAINVLGLLYVPLLLGHFIWLRSLPQGEWWVLWLLCVIFAGDTAAFYCGRLWGKRKLYPQVSPGKTWAGAVGGLAFSLVVGVGLGRWALPGLNSFGLGWLALFLGVVGLFGDLFESMLKRQVAVKDAGMVLPGHGGILDRLDSLLFAAPAVLYARLFLFGV